MKKLLATTALTLALTFSGMAYANDDAHGKEDHKGPPPFMEEALSKLPEKDAAQFRDTMKQAHEKNKALIDQMHKLREERHAIFIAPKFDKDAYLAKGEELKKFRETMHKQMKANMKEAFVMAVGGLSQEERKTLSESMEHMHHGHHGHHHWNHEDHDKSSSDSSQE